jgi:sugar phosphate permease
MVSAFLAASRLYNVLMMVVRMFIIEGACSAAVALLGFWFLPSTPATTRWLSEEERQLAQARMEKDRLIDAQEQEPLLAALKGALKDRRTWLFCAIQNFHYAGLSFINFLPTSVNLYFGCQFFSIN